MSLLTDPTDGQQWNGYTRGDRVHHARLGVTEFYRYDSKNHEILVFDKYGVQRAINADEVNRGPN